MTSALPPHPLSFLSGAPLVFRVPAVLRSHLEVLILPPPPLLKAAGKFKAASGDENLVLGGDVACLCGAQPRRLFDVIPA